MPIDAPVPSVSSLILPFIENIEKGETKKLEDGLKENKGKLSQQDLSTLLHAAINKANKDAVEVILAEGADIDTFKTENENTESNTRNTRRAAQSKVSSPVALAVSSGAPIDLGPNSSSKDEALMYAASHGFVDSVSSLILHGAKDSSSTPVLYAAALRGHTNVMEILLKNKFDVNAQNEQGNTALHAILSRPGTDVQDSLSLLFSFGANLSPQNNQGDTPLIKAVRQNINSESISSLITKLQENSISLTTLNKKGAFHEAAIWGNITLMKLFLDLGKIDANLPDLEGNTALHLTAVQKGNVAHAKFLVENAANPSAKNKVGDTPLNVVGSVELAEVLVQHHSDLLSENDSGLTPVMSAIKRGNPAIAAYLATSNVDQFGKVPSLVNVVAKLGTSVDAAGNSILHNSVEQPELFKFIVASDPEGTAKLLTQQNGEGDTPMHAACKVDSWQVVQFLVEKGADYNIQNNLKHTPFKVAVESGSVYCVVTLLETTPQETSSEELNGWKDDDGNSLIHKAVECSFPHGVEVLAKKGANVNMPNPLADEDAYVDGGTPLHLAAMRGELKCIEALLDNGADINSVESNENNTPLHLACYHQQNKSAEILLNRGADIKLQNINNESVLYFAEMAGNSTCVKLLSDYLSKMK